MIENVPVFPGCERGNNEKKRKCMSEKIARFVQKKFNTDLVGDLGLTGRQRISVIFKIDKSGNASGELEFTSKIRKRSTKSNNHYLKCSLVNKEVKQ